MERVRNSIEPTPILEGKDVERFIRLMDEPLTQKDIEIRERIRKRRKIHFLRL